MFLRIQTLLNGAKRLSRDGPARMLSRILGMGSLVGLVLFTVVGVVGNLARAHVYKDALPHAQTWKEFVFTIVGGLDAAAEADAASVVYAVVVRLLAAIVVGGLVTSLFCALAERIGDMKLKGLLPPVLKGHYIIAGFGPSTAELVRMLLNPPEDEDLACWNPTENVPPLRRRRVLVCTGFNVEDARVALGSALPPALFARVSFAAGDLHASGAAADQLFMTLSLPSARQLYVLGDSEDPRNSAVSTLAFARKASAFLATHPPAVGTIPVHVQCDAETPFEFHRDLFDIACGSQVPAVHLVPFGIYEGWARRIWGSLTANREFAPDFAPLSGNRYAHIVVVGLSGIGSAVFQEAIRVCHFASGARTRITVVDPDSALHRRFLIRHPSLHLLPDIHIDWLNDSLESEPVRDLLRRAAEDTDCLLSIAICLPDDDEALAAALSLPEEVYRHRMAAKPKTIRDRYRESAPRVWVRQRSAATASAARRNLRFEFVRPFGMDEGGFPAEFLQESSAMLLNAAYAWPSLPLLEEMSHDAPECADRISKFRDAWREHLSRDGGRFGIPPSERISLLRDVLTLGGNKTALRFRHGAFRSWIALPQTLRRANAYAPDSWRVLLRALGLQAERQVGAVVARLVADNDKAFHSVLSRSRPELPLAEAEHNRWMADRILLGYRPPRPDSGEIRDDDFLYHPDLVPFSDLSDTDVGKDNMALLSIPLLLALEGIRLTITTLSPTRAH